MYAINDNALQEEKEAFLNKLKDTLEKIPSQLTTILGGDFNGRVGNKDTDVVGKFGEETLNENGKRIIDVCREFNLIVANTFYQHKDILTYTWTEPARNLRSIIDFFIVQKEKQKIITDVKSIFASRMC